MRSQKFLPRLLLPNGEKSYKYEQVIRIAPALISGRNKEIKEKRVGKDIRKYHGIIREYLINKRYNIVFCERTKNHKSSLLTS